MGFANPVKIHYLLYSEPDFRNWSKKLYDSGITQFLGKWWNRDYDGYTLFFSLIFDNLISDGDSIGISIPLPNGDGSDLTGFAITYNIERDKSTV